MPEYMQVGGGVGLGVGRSIRVVGFFGLGEKLGLRLGKWALGYLGLGPIKKKITLKVKIKLKFNMKK